MTTDSFVTGGNKIFGSNTISVEDAISVAADGSTVVLMKGYCSVVAPKLFFIENNKYFSLRQQGQNLNKLVFDGVHVSRQNIRVGHFKTTRMDTSMHSGLPIQ